MRYFLDLLEIYLFISLPQAFTLSWFCFTFWGIRVERFLPRLIGFGFVVSAFQDIGLLAMPTYYYVFYSISVVFIVFHLFFRELRFRTKLLMLVMYFCTAIVLEMLSLSIAKQFIDINQIRIGPIENKMIFYWPFIIATALVNFHLYRKRIYLGLSIARVINEAKDVSILTYIMLIFSQIVITSIYLFSKFFHNDHRPAAVFFYLEMLSIVVVSFMAVRLIVKTREKAVLLAQNVYLGDLLQLFNAIRGQRHDFINHMQVMYSMLNMQKTDRLAAYMKEVVEDIQTVSEMSDKIPLQAVSALFQAKTAIAADKRILFEAHYPEKTGPLDPTRTVDLVRVTGALIDRAFDKAMEMPQHLRRVALLMAVDNGGFTIKATAFGSFARGAEKRLGCDSPFAVVTERISHYRGSFSIQENDEEGIIYIASFPCRGEQAIE
jgi:hypothetical protein